MKIKDDVGLHDAICNLADTAKEWIKVIKNEEINTLTALYNMRLLKQKFYTEINAIAEYLDMETNRDYMKIWDELVGWLEINKHPEAGNHKIFKNWQDRFWSNKKVQKATDNHNNWWQFSSTIKQMRSVARTID
jgi:hypothetical protein